MVIEPLKLDDPKAAGVDVPIIKGANKPETGITPKAPPMNNAIDNPMTQPKPNDPAPWDVNNPEGGGGGDDPAVPANPAAPTDPATPDTPPVDPNQPGAAAPNEPGSDDPKKPIDPQSALAQKEHWRDKYNRDAIDPKTGKTYKELLEEKDKPEAPVVDPQSVKKETPEDFQAKQDFLWKHTDKKYTPEEFSHIKGVSANKGISLDEAAKSEDGYINFQRGKVANQDNIPSPSFPEAPAGGGQPLSPDKIADMSEEDFRKEEEKAHNAAQRTGVGGGV